MAKKMSLGRGLDSIFGDNEIETKDSQVQKVRIGMIEPKADQPRQHFDSEALSQLADSIAIHGVLQPILVRPSSQAGFYQIIAGERRWRAARMAGLRTVPVVVMDADDRTVMELALVENLQRQDLNPMEEAMGFKQLMEEYGLTQEQVSEKVSKSRSAVANALRLLGLCQPVLEKLRAGELTAGHARAILSIKNEKKIVWIYHNRAGGCSFLLFFFVFVLVLF